jgi:hypothetical protein
VIGEEGDMCESIMQLTYTITRYDSDSSRPRAIRVKYRIYDDLLPEHDFTMLSCVPRSPGTN